MIYMPSFWPAGKSGNIVLPLEIELARFLLMDIPERIDTDRIHAECLAHLNTMLPVFGGDTGVMYLRALITNGLPSSRKVPFPIEKSCFSPCLGLHPENRRITQQVINPAKILFTCFI